MMYLNVIIIVIAKGAVLDGIPHHLMEVIEEIDIQTTHKPHFSTLIFLHRLRLVTLPRLLQH